MKKVLAEFKAYIRKEEKPQENDSIRAYNILIT